MKKIVVVGMSGGVDSSVAALLLKAKGYQVIGLFMKNWDEKDEKGTCLSSSDFEDVQRVCAQIDIPCYTVNFVKEYQESVFSHFLTELKKGYTPNPDILCNREIKFKVFLDKAMSLGADYLATGHYCTIEKEKSFYLHKGRDLNKDQSYFLYTLSQKILEKVLFPIGHLTKQEVRSIALSHNLFTAKKKDSVGICFIGKRNFKKFLLPYLGYQKGAFENTQGRILGYHDGLAYYTIGQRKGLKIGGAGDAWFVVAKDIKRNVIIVEQGLDHPSLYQSELIATDLSWIANFPFQTPYPCSAKIRYRQKDQACIIEKISEGKAFVRFLEPQRAITPRQSIVFYTGNRCLGGGMIEPEAILRL
ncbi:tRNA 2-thiouridine(34) synthase MnmA [Candidatus Rhabdochlamydia porcellionis]|nr:tRNA 2-thiouridine(34) synthase MnmA [Candidatus Rhabdochlamydia porcellionis]